MKYLITGGCGFIGAQFGDYLLTNDETVTGLVNVDKISPVSNSFLSEKYADDVRYDDRGIATDLVDSNWSKCLNGFVPDIVVHFAAESHVDRSCEDVKPFIDSNITGTMNVANYCIREGIPMIYISTDEVYGELLSHYDEPFCEWKQVMPRNPYAATKASGEFLVTGLMNAGNFSDYVITRCSNNFGPLQDDTKFIPVCIKALSEGRKIPLYGKGAQIRDWLHVEDHCKAIHMLSDALVNGHAGNGSVYNIGGSNELTNLELSLMICDAMGVDPDDGIELVEDPRGNAHDYRYAINSDKIRTLLKWTPEKTHPFDESLKETIQWYTQ